MKKILFLIIVTAGLINTQENINYCAAAKIGTYEKLAKMNKVNYPGDSNIDITFYKLDIEVQDISPQVKGVVTIKGKSLSDNLTSINLDFNSGMNLISLSQNELNPTYSHSNNLITIQQNPPLSNGEEFTFEIEYDGDPTSTGFGSFAVIHRLGIATIWSLSEPYGASSWWPCKDTPADKADSAEVIITCDDKFYGVSNGNLLSVDNVAKAKKKYHWKTTYPIAQYLISIAVTNYEIYEDEFIYNDGQSVMPIMHYNYPENLTQSRKDQLDATKRMLELFSDKFGLYPFTNEKYGHAEFSWGGAMEHQTVSSMGSFFSGIVSHELGHQWFGDKITCKDWHHIWLNEGFATYLEAVYTESRFGFDLYLRAIQNEMSAAFNAQGSIYVQDISSVGQIFNNARSYAKGAVVLHMLRGILGDEVFWNVMKSYATDPELSYSVATTEDFQRIAETVSGQDLDYFFSEWIYGENYPHYNVLWSSTETTPGKYNLGIELSQIQGGATPFFTMPVQIKVTTENFDTTFTLFNNTNGQQFSLNLDAAPTAVEIDPSDWILDSATVNKSHLSIFEPPTTYSLGYNFPNPFNPSTIISFSLPENSNVTLILFDALGRKVALLINSFYEKGNHYFEFFPSQLNLELASGVYIYRLTTDKFEDSKKMIYLK